LTRQVSLLSNEFQNSGYTTHLIGKWHLGYCSFEYMPTYRGFDSFYGYLNGGEDYYTHQSSITWESTDTDGVVDVDDLTAMDLFIDDEPAINNAYDGVYGVWWQRDEALKLLQTKAEAQENDRSAAPFFLYLALQAAHNPRQAPDDYIALYTDSEDATAAEYNHDRVTMKAQTTTIDDAVRSIISYVQDSGLWRDTLIVFSSDNGGKKLFGDNAPLRGYKNTSWEGGVRSAAFVTGGCCSMTDALRGSTFSYPMHVTDWYATLLSAAGLEVQYVRSTRLYQSSAVDETWSNTPRIQLNGMNMWPFITQHQTDDAFFENEREILLNVNNVWCPFSSCGALRRGRFKYIRGDNVGTLLPEYDGSDWDRSFVYDAIAAEQWCQERRDEFAAYHGVSITFDSMVNSVGCQSTETGCLFDLTLDPCEYYDLSAVYPELQASLQQRLDAYQSESVVPLMGENYANELASKAEIDPQTVCANPNFWCPYKSYDQVEWEHQLYASMKVTDEDVDADQYVMPTLSVLPFMSLWLATCVGIYLVCNHEKKRKHGYFTTAESTRLELQPLVVH